MTEAEKCIQATSYDAACVMLGRALEALCRDQLKAMTSPVPGKKKGGRLMLGEGLKQLRDAKIIDEKLLSWSTQLQAFRNAAAHATDEAPPSRTEVLDLQTFAYAIIEYVYDLTQRYNEFSSRVSAAASAKAAKKP